MSPDTWGIVIAGLSGVLMAGFKLVARLHLQHCLAKLAASGDAEAMKRLTQIAPPDVLSSGPTMLLGFVLATALSAGARSEVVTAPASAPAQSGSACVGLPCVPLDDLEAKAGPQAARQCISAADCDEGQRCERGRCVANAKRPAAPGGPPRPAPQSFDDSPSGWALRLPPHEQRIDPYLETGLPQRIDVVLTRRRRL